MSEVCTARAVSADGGGSHPTARLLAGSHRPRSEVTVTQTEVVR
jgi:hypothetical protein